eukprot:15361314-Ditylum_brightwellii.AAC.1
MGLILDKNDRWGRQGNVSSDGEMWDEDEYNSVWAEKIVLDDLVVAVLNAMGNDPSFFIEEIMLRFFAPQENIKTA